MNEPDARKILKDWEEWDRESPAPCLSEDVNEAEGYLEGIEDERKRAEPLHQTARDAVGILRTKGADPAQAVDLLVVAIKEYERQKKAGE